MKRKVVLSAGLVVLSWSVFASSFNTFGRTGNDNEEIKLLSDTAQVSYNSINGTGTPRVGKELFNLKKANENQLFNPSIKAVNLSEALKAECNNKGCYTKRIVSATTYIGKFSGKAMSNGNVLNWSTSLEENNKGFEIERSTNAIEFKNVGFKRPLSINGNSNERLDYTFVDLKFGIDTYYRIKQVDINGKSEYSPIIMVKANLTLKTKRNIAEASKLNMELSSNKTDIATLLLLDESGNVVYKKNETIVRGKNNFQINTFNLPSGWYVLQVKNGLGALVLTRKIVEI